MLALQPLHITYTIVPKDVTSFCIYTTRTHPQAKKDLIKGYAFFAIALVTGALAFSRANVWSTLSMVLIYLCVWALIYPLIMRYLTYTAAKQYAKHAGPGLIGSHQIIISEQGIREQTTVNDSLTSWPGVRRIEQTNEHIFVFIENHQAHVIPKRDFTEQEAQHFFTTAWTYWEAAQRVAGSPA